MKVLNFMKGSTFMLLLLFVLLSAACTSSSDYTLGRWHQRSDFDGKTRSGAACFTIGDIGYIIGGTNGKAQRLKSMYSYNIEGDYFTELFSEDATATMPSARNYATGFAVGGKGYVSCGWDGTNYVGDTWEYNPSTNTWKQMDDFLGGARYGALAFTIGNDAYMGCGYDENYLKDFYKFNPSAAAGSQWTKVNGYSGSKRRFGMYFEINSVVYLIGGENNGDDCKDFWKFDGTTWTKLRYITSDDDLVTEGTDDSYNDDYTSIVRNSGVAFSLNGKGYIALGRTAAGTYRKNYWIYDPSTDLWSNNDGDVTDFEGSQRINPVCITNGKRAFVSTGQNGSSLYYDDTWEFSPNEYKEK